MKKDDVGNLLVLDIKLCNKLNVSLVNIYGPNQDSPDFYNKIYDTPGLAPLMNVLF